jgi:hypothetical protein
MARLTPVEPANATGPAKEIFDGPLKGKHFNVFKALANSPAALQGYLGLSGAVAHGSLAGADVEQRITITPGMARKEASCSIGWWVGPSSPTPIESCVNR